MQFADLHDTPGRMFEKGVIQVRSHNVSISIHIYYMCFNS